MLSRVLTSRSLKWYFEIGLAKQNLENQIQQGFQTPAAAINLTPY